MMVEVQYFPPQEIALNLNLSLIHTHANHFHIAGDPPYLYKSNLDQLFDDWNMAAIVSLLNFLDQKLV